MTIVEQMRALADKLEGTTEPSGGGWHPQADEARTIAAELDRLAGAALDEIGSIKDDADSIRGDWTDPRSDVRDIWARCSTIRTLVGAISIVVRSGAQ